MRVSRSDPSGSRLSDSWELGKSIDSETIRCRESEMSLFALSTVTFHDPVWLSGLSGAG